MKLSVNHRKHSGTCAARCHFPMAPVISNESDRFKSSDLDTCSQK
jgi:hypothetical protein